MSALLRSVSVLQTLKNVTKTSIYNEAIKNLKTVPISNLSRVVGVRCFSVQQTLQENREQTSHSLNDMLARLDHAGREHGAISKNAVDEVHHRIKSTNEVNSTHGLLLLRCCGSFLPATVAEQRTQLAHAIWATLEQREVPMDLSHYNALLRVYLENEHDFAPLDFLTKLQEKGLEPNRVTYQRLVERYSQMGDIEGAGKVLEFMKEKNHPINENIFNSLILGHSRAGDLESSVETLQLMQEKGLEPSVDTYAALAVAQAESGDMDGVNATIALSHEKEQGLQARDLLEVVYALTAKGHQALVPQVLSSTKKGIMGYNLDCKNLIFRLVSAGHDEQARLVYDTMDSNNSGFDNTTGLFFVRQLIACDRPLAGIMSLCEDLASSNPFLLQQALKIALESNRKMVGPLMDAMQAKGIPIRPHYFWPLFVDCCRANDVDGVYRAIRAMIALNVPTSLVTLVDYILPFLIGQQKMSSEEVVEKLKGRGLYWGDLVNAVARYQLQHYNIRDALDIVTLHPAYLNWTLRIDLSSAVKQCSDYDGAAALLAKLVHHDKITRQGAAEEAGDDQQQSDAVLEDRDVAGKFLEDVTRRSASVDMLSLLQAMERRGLSISRRSGAKVMQQLGATATPPIQAVMDALCSGTLQMKEEPLPVFSKRARDVDIAEYEKILEEKTKDGSNTQQTLVTLLLAYAKQTQVQKAEETLERLVSDHQFEAGIGVRVILLDMFHEAGMLQQAMEQFSAISAIDPNATIDGSKILKLVQLTVQEGRVDDAIAFLESESKRRPSEPTNTESAESQRDDRMNADHGQQFNSRFIDSICQSILQPFVEKADVEGVKRLSVAIMDNQFARPSRALLRSYVAVHLARDDLDGAFDALLECQKKYNLFPHKHEVLQELIKKEDTERLQQILDLTTDQFGESNSLLDLVFAFVEQGRIRQAKKILQTPGLRINQARLDHRFNVYLEKKMTHCMEDCVAATVDANVDRPKLYNYLLQAYKKEEDCEKALGLWTQMQEENLAIPEAFLFDLGHFLKSQGHEPPFTVPENRPQSVPALQQQQTGPKQQRQLIIKRQPGTTPSIPRAFVEKSPVILEFRELLTRGQVDEALAMHAKLSAAGESPLNQRDNALLVEKLLDLDRLSDAVAVTKVTPSLQGRSFRLGVQRRLMARLAESGDTESLLYFHDTATAEHRGFLSSKLCVAYGISNRAEEYLTMFSKSLDNVQEDQRETVQRNIPKVGLLWLINRDEALLPKLEEIAVKCEAKGLPEFNSVLWAYHFIKNNEEKATQLKGNLVHEHGIPTAALCDHMRTYEDVSLAPRIVQELQDNPHLVRQFAQQIVYSSWIDILCKQNKGEEALQVLKTVMKHTEISTMNIQTMAKLKDLLAKDNIEFPYALPVNARGTQTTQQQQTTTRSSSSSSSSSSDSDDVKKP